MEIPVTNVGKRDGAEVVHWFISDPFSTITRPCKELKHFEKQLIKAGETHIFRFEIDPMRDLGFVNANGEHFLENGEYYVIVKDQKSKIHGYRLIFFYIAGHPPFIILKDRWPAISILEQISILFS